jgi:glycosyltransferase involved in cell wall biosynthesis
LYLWECLRSVCEQTEPSWELLAVDDRSEDGSRELVLEASRRDPRIRLLDNRGAGIIPALQTAFSACQGKFITRMDSDDRMAPERLAVMSKQLGAHGSGHLALGQVRYFSDRGISDGYARYEAWLNGLTATGSNFREIYKECVVPSPCWMAFRSDLQACGAFDPDRYPEDYDLCFRFYEGGLRCLPSDRLLHHWRDYDARTSRNSEHYAQNYFLELKTHYFLKLDRQPHRPLVLWGAGFKGKKVARLLAEQGLEFHWACDNPNKIGKKIYGIPLQHFSLVATLERPQSLITVASPEAQEQIREYLHQQGGQPGSDYFFFC